MAQKVLGLLFGNHPMGPQHWLADLVRVAKSLDYDFFQRHLKTWSVLKLDSYFGKDFQVKMKCDWKD